jgi:hypothetical protein
VAGHCHHCTISFRKNQVPAEEIPDFFVNSVTWFGVPAGFPTEKALTRPETGGIIEQIQQEYRVRTGMKGEK